MSIDPARALAVQFAPFDVTIERGRLRMFAAAIGQTDPVYCDVGAARAAGYPDLPVPPTFPFSVFLEPGDPWRFLADVGVDLRGVLHGEQTFTFHRMLYANDTVTVRPRIIEAYVKNARMDFLTLHVDLVRKTQTVAEFDSLVVLREVAA